MHSVAGYAIGVRVISVSLLKEEYVAYFNNSCYRKIRKPAKKTHWKGLEIGIGYLRNETPVLNH
jgi:hypothetical protein